MKHRLLSIVMVLLLVLGLATSVAQENTDPITRIDEYLTQQNFSGSILIAEGGDILLSKGYGFANREWDILNTSDTKFRIGGLTKQITAMGILLMQEQGLLSIDDPVCDYVEECPEAWQGITIQHLLAMTDGIQNFTGFSNYSDLMPIETTQQAVIERFIDRPLGFEPGTKWNSNNSGYVVLGYIIEKYSGNHRYQIYLAKNFFEPLGMMNTGYDSNKSIIKNRAEGYASSSAKADYIHMSIPGGAGGLYSTTEDLFIWTRALHNGEVVSQESWDAMWAVAEDIGNGVATGYGLDRREIDGHLSVDYDGKINGFSSIAAYFVDDEITVILLSNIEQDPEPQFNRIVSELFAEE